MLSIDDSPANLLTPIVSTPIVGTTSSAFEITSLIVYAIEAFLPLAFRFGLRGKVIEQMNKDLGGINSLYTTGWEVLAWGNLLGYAYPFVYYLLFETTTGIVDVTWFNIVYWVFLPACGALLIADISLFVLSSDEWINYYSDFYELTFETPLIEMGVFTGFTAVAAAVLVAEWYLL